MSEPTEAAFQFQPASRERQKLKLAIQGPSGSGKTWGALALAHALGKRVAVIDTENGSASLYAGLFPAFDTLSLGAPYTSRRYAEAVRAARKAEYDVVVIDSLTHQWAGPGGILARKEEMDARGGNGYANWRTFSKEHTDFLAFLLNEPIHLIATMRSKQDYVIEAGDGKKAAPKKVGLAAVQREGAEYEFTTVFELQMDHKAIASKDRTHLFDGIMVDLSAEETGTTLRKWLESGATPDAPTPTTRPARIKPEEASK